MIKNKLLTVIVPAYNIENYIERCIESIINQSYKDLHIIVIDDCSTDQTYEKIRTLSEKYENITTIKNNVNKGVSWCRNYAISLIQTKYVAFLDGDDWLDYNCYSKAIKKMETDDSIDLTLWNINTVYSRSQCIKRYYYDEENLITKEFALSLLSKINNSNIYISPLLGNKVFRTNLLKENKMKFNGVYYEDDVFMFYCLLHSNKIQFITNCSLYYFQRDNSTMHSFSKKNIQELFDSFQTLKETLVEESLWEENKKYYYSYYEKCLKNLHILIRHNSQTDKEERAYLYELFCNFNEKVSLSEYLTYCDINLIQI